MALKGAEQERGGAAEERAACGLCLWARTERRGERGVLSVQLIFLSLFWVACGWTRESGVVSK